MRHSCGGPLGNPMGPSGSSFSSRGVLKNSGCSSKMPLTRNRKTAALNAPGLLSQIIVQMKKPSET